MYTCTARKCRNRGVDLGGNNFCPECGAGTSPLPVKTAGGASARAEGVPGLTLQKSIVGGDQVINHSQTIYYQDETKNVLTCAVSGRRAAQTEGHECPGCRKWVHKDYFDAQGLRCNPCNEAEGGRLRRQFEERARELLSDNVLGSHELSELRAMGESCGLSSEEQDQVITKLRAEMAGPVLEQNLSILDAKRLRTLQRQIRQGVCGDEGALEHGLEALGVLVKNNPECIEGAVLLVSALAVTGQWQKAFGLLGKLEPLAADTPQRYLLEAAVCRAALSIDLN